MFYQNKHFVISDEISNFYLVISISVLFRIFIFHIREIKVSVNWKTVIRSDHRVLVKDQL